MEREDIPCFSRADWNNFSDERERRRKRKNKRGGQRCIPLLEMCFKGYLNNKINKFLKIILE